MKNLDSIRANQNQRQNKKEKKALKRKHSRSRRGLPFRIFVNFLKVFIILILVVSAALMYWSYKQVDFTFGDDLENINMKLSSTIYIDDGLGGYREYEQFKSSDKRIWVSIDEVPQYMKDAFVAIEDQRFYKHKGVDIKRTLGAVLNVFVKGDSSYGGSTITQQLVKNITNDKERTNSRKIREMSRALVLETKMSKDEILELYMNSIYLSQGVHGVQAAANLYFGKDVDKLSLAQSASIAGITQYPTTYDPFINPDNNREKQLTVLGKMLELGFISPDEYDAAVNEKLVFNDPDDEDTKLQQSDSTLSYFSDHIFEQAKKDLMKEFEYTEQYAEQLLFNGGLKIYSTMDPDIQSIAEDYYENAANFPKFPGPDTPQSAVIVTDPATGQLKAIVGGRGQKEDARVLNRATQSKRQPGSTIKPIAAYAPALEENVINLSTYIDNSPIKIGNWTPSNANGRFSGPVPVKTAVSWSYNMPAIRTVQALTVDKSFDYLKNKMHMSSVVENREKNGKTYSDKNLSALALGGFTDGITPLEMSTAYSCIANGGMYIEPSSYTKICDKNDNVILEKTPEKNKVFSKETAFLAQELLKGVVKSGTASGSTIAGMDTCGKTGTTDDNKDKWFIGFTPYYCTTVWFGYDSPKVISSSTNPAIKIWKDIMKEIHEGLDNAKFEVPSGISKARVCGFTGKHASLGCGNYEYANEKFLTGYCHGKHPKTELGSSNYYYTPAPEDKEEEEKKEENNNSNQNTNQGQASGGTPTGHPYAYPPQTLDEILNNVLGSSGGSNKKPASSPGQVSGNSANTGSEAPSAAPTSPATGSVDEH